jgi:hypothetical protein
MSQSAFHSLNNVIFFLFTTVKAYFSEGSQEEVESYYRSALSK